MPQNPKGECGLTCVVVLYLTSKFSLLLRPFLMPKAEGNAKIKSPEGVKHPSTTPCTQCLTPVENPPYSYGRRLFENF